MFVRFNSREILAVLVCFTLFIVAAHIAILILRYEHGVYFKAVYDMFFLDGEANLPAFFSTLLLFFASFLLFIISLIRKREERREFKYWLGLAAVFLFLSVDENALIHERVLNIYWKFAGPSDYDNYVWLVPYGLLVLTIGALYIRFLLALPRKTQFHFVAAAVMFVGGALGLEALAALHVGQSWHQAFDPETTLDFGYYFIATCEEALEMLGVITFIGGLLHYIEKEGQPLHIYAGESPSG